jgi:primosomal protein N'
MIPRSDVGPVGSGRRVVVGTERDLPGLEVDLSIIVDGDGPIMAPNYRAGEEGLRLLGRAVAAAGQGRGRRAIVQTFDPEHGAMVALRTRDPLAYMRAVASTRAELGFPPGGEVLVLEATPVTPEMTRGFPERIGGRAEIHGPAETGTGARWLVQGRSLDSARVVLRQIASEWRESGVRVRIDADPVDL